MKTRQPKRRVCGTGGFLLISVFLGLMIIAILAAALTPSISSQLDATDLRTERDALASLKTDIEGSFNETDLTRNIGALSGTALGASTSAATVTEDRTQPGTGIAGSKTVTAMTWQVKIATIRGHTLTVGAAVSRDADPTGVYFNRLGWSRVLLVGPTNEATQRYLLVSMMTPSHRPLAFPTGATVFDEMWANSWESAAATPPGAWSTSLAASAYQLWSERTSNNRTNASRLLVQRITQPKYVLTVVDNHPTDGAWVDIGPVSNAIVAAANGGTYSSNSVSELANGIPFGRQIVVRRGASAGTATEVQRFLMTAPMTVTVQ